jgi:hypothetical protein
VLICWVCPQGKELFITKRFGVIYFGMNLEPMCE